MAEELNIITSDVNAVDVNTDERKVVITNESDTTTVTLSAAQTTVVQIATIGPKGDKGDVGNIDAAILATTGSNIFIGNQTITGSISLTNGITGSLLGTASFATTASYALNAGAGAGFPYSGSAVITGSLLVTEGITGSFSGSVFGYVSNEATTSFITNSQTSSFVTNLQTGSMTVASASWAISASNYVETDPQYNAEKAKYLTTGSSNTTQTISGSLVINQNLTVLGSQSVQYITSSQLNIQTNLITVNTATPAVRFGGLAVYDSGSTGTGLTGSILWDSQHNVWIYTNPSGSEYDGAMFLTGPKNNGTTGNEVGITENYLAKGAGSHHMTSSQISDDGIKVTIPGNLVVNGGITGSFSGSVVGYVPNTATSSFITNQQTSSFVINSQTASFATTGSNTFRGNQTISGSLTVSGSTVMTGSVDINGTTGTTLFSTNADTLIITGSLIVTGSSIMTGSLNVTNGITGSFSGSVVGYVPNTATSSFITNTQTSSFVTNTQTGSFVLNTQTGSFVLNTQTGSFVLNTQTSSFVTNTQTGSFAITGSNTFKDNQTISGSLTISGSIIVTQTAGVSMVSSIANSFDVKMNNSSGERGIRIYAADGLTTTPAGAAIQFYSADHSTYTGQFYIDSAAHDNAAIIFRTAPTTGTITERMRITSSGSVSITASVNVSTANNDSEIYINEVPVSPAINVFNYLNFT